MKRRDSCPRRAWSVALAIALIGALSSATLAQGTGRVFGFGDYPGGTLHTVFEMVRGAGAPSRTCSRSRSPTMAAWRTSCFEPGAAGRCEIL